MRDIGCVLITGARGFLGKSLVARLKQIGADFVETDLPSSDVANEGRLDCDITAFDQVDAVVRSERFQTILHCGAVSGPMVLADQPRLVWEINSQGTCNVLEAARRHGVGRIVVCSTTDVYGFHLRRIDEKSIPDPTSVYAASKLSAEQAMLGYARQHGLDGVALRLSWIYGPGRTTATTLESLLRRSIDGTDTVLDAHPSDLSHHLFIDDAVDGLLRAATSAQLNDRVYNITRGEGVAMERIAEIVRQAYPGVRIEFGRESPGGTGPTGIDQARSRQDLGFEAGVSLQVGLQRYLRALSSHDRGES